MIALEKFEQVAKPLRLGTIVRLKTRWRRGHVGEVVEDLSPGDISGAHRYGVRLSNAGKPDSTADMCRCELSVLKKRSNQ